jgi:hypothetical protein
MTKNLKFDVFCPKCNILVEAKLIADGNGGIRSDALNPIDEVDSEYHGDNYYVYLCNRCSQPFLIRESVYGVPGEFETADTNILYPIESNPIIEELPSPIKSSFIQAKRSYSASLFEPCVLMCRKCLEATCKLFGAQGKELNSRLTSLFDDGHIDKRLLDWTHEIRLVGNEAAHEIETILDKKDAQDILDFTEAILLYVFSLTKRFEAFKLRRKK